MTRTIWPWVRLLGGAGILALVVWRLGTGAVHDGLRVIDVGALAAALAIGVLTTVLSAWRWCLVARGLGLRLTLRDAVADYYQSVFVNAALPGGVLGDVDRAVRHGRDSGDVGRGVRAVVLERSAGQLVLLVVGAVVLTCVPSPVSTLLAHNAAAAAAVTATVGAAAVLVTRRDNRVGRAVRAGLREVRSGLLTGPGVLLASAAALAGHLATFLLAARVAGTGTPLLRLAPLLLLALLAMSLPLNVGGWGPREGVLAWAFGAAGLSAAQGLTVAVVYGVLAFVAAAPGAVVVVVRAVRRLRADALVTEARRVRLTAPVSPAPGSQPSAPPAREVVGV